MWIHAFLLATAALSAQEMLERSMAYHDPGGVFDETAIQIELTESRPNGADRKTSIVIDNDNNRFSMKRKAEGNDATAIVTHGDTVIEAGSDADDAHERARRTRNYYVYLYGLPMKLTDPGTILAPDAKQTEFMGHEAFELKVTYEEAVGGDTWYFYLDPESYALIGYRFYHDESKNDGEYITLEGEAKGAGLRLPKTRRWYRHQDESFLGEDTIVSIASP